MAAHPVIKYRFRERRRTADEWTSVNEVLLDSEVGRESDTGMTKTGDGATAWSDLDYDVSGRRQKSSTFADGQGFVWSESLGMFVPGDLGKTYAAGTGITIDNPDSSTPTISSTLGSITLSSRVDTYADLPTQPVDAGTTIWVDADKQAYISDGSSWPTQYAGISVGSSADKFETLIEWDAASLASGVGRHYGVLSAATAAVVTQAGRSALKFAGVGDYVTYAIASSLLDPTIPFSLEAIIWGDDWADWGTDAHGVLGGEYSASQQQNNWNFGPRPDGLVAGFYESGWHTTFGPTPPTGQWTHVYLGVSGATTLFGVDGAVTKKANVGDWARDTVYNVFSSGTYNSTDCITGGYIQWLRMSRGLRYVDDYTPPLGP